MRREVGKYLYDIRAATERIHEFSTGKSFEDFCRDAMLSSAIERQFEIIGEALNQLHKIAPDVVSRINESRRIIAFRNILIHGYAEVDARVVWNVVELKLPVLKSEVAKLLQEAGPA